jgi:hypothetical protein
LKTPVPAWSSGRNGLDFGAIVLYPQKLPDLLPALVSLGVCARSSGGVMAARAVLPTARCEFDSRPELHLNFFGSDSRDTK